MNTIVNSIIYALGSATFGIILSLLLLFQWHRQYAKEQAVKNTLFAMRRKIDRWKMDKDIDPGRAADVMEDLDSVLATLGARGPFKKAMDLVIQKVVGSNEVQGAAPLQQASPFQF
ncbi:MAG TPA: hypothetical protein VHD37_02265 [Candidatus Paceibacterota bacterium]|nr:hypothetical protein [Candidatus Paceibacterota bacterium]